MIRAGQKYRAMQPLDVITFSSWRTPATYGSTGTLPKGEVFSVDQGPHSEAIAVYCSSEKNDTLQAVVISEANRSSARYRDYYLCIAIKDILERCERLSD